jgi:hypothetical protein
MEARLFPLLALFGHPAYADERPLLGVKRSWRGLVSMSANDPKRTLAWRDLGEKTGARPRSRSTHGTA